MADGAEVPRRCEWTSQAQAFGHFARFAGATQSQQHIKPLHWYAACRLVLEGGFHPDDVTPRPPFQVTQRKGEALLSLAPELATGREATVLGGLKTKNVDVVVNKAGLGPVMAVSCKGMTGAFRNLTNRMEETIGECTNLHITYPAMVFGYLFVIRANRDGEVVSVIAEPDDAPVDSRLKANDIAMGIGGPVESIIRFHSALRELTGRRGIRDDVSRYEAIALSLVEVTSGSIGTPLPDFPPADSPLRLELFFQTLYLRYDERYVFTAPDLRNLTRRLEWSSASPLFNMDDRHRHLGYEVRTFD